MVSIIIPCYNYGIYLKEAVESVISQSHEHWECIIVNDGSTDNTEEIAQELCSGDTRIRYLYKENGGHSSARNYGIANSSGKYILPLDPDDKLNDDFIARAVEVLEKDPLVKIVGSHVQLFGTIDKLIKLPEYSLRYLLIINYMFNTSLFRRLDFQNTNGYDEMLICFEDWDLWIKLLKTGGTVHQLDMVGFYYRKKENSVFIDASRNEKRVYNDLMRVYMNNVDIYSKHFATPIELLQENEKLQRIVKGYHNSKTYKIGLQIQKLKRAIFKK